MQKGDSRLCINIEEAAKVLNIGRSLAYEMARQGVLPTLAFGRRRVVPKEAITRLIQNTVTKKMDES